ncbi:MAG: hypothetical protein EOO77_46900 [Oxalobacteraceae bacterium]|nr:MAG: hypothetical protein EOO77_46900 [Oxalobacteraceae bacterium]
MTALTNKTSLVSANETTSHITPAYTTIADWCRMSGMGRSSTYEALGAGHLRARKLGTRTLIDVQHALTWLGSLPPAIIRPSGANRRNQAV